MGPMSHLLGLLLSCWLVAELSTRLNNKHYGSTVATYADMDFTASSSAD